MKNKEILFFGKNSRDHVSKDWVYDEKGHPETFFNLPKNIDDSFTFNLRHFSPYSNNEIKISHHACILSVTQEEKEFDTLIYDPAKKDLEADSKDKIFQNIHEVYFTPLFKDGFVSLKTPNGIEASISWKAEKEKIIMTDFNGRTCEFEKRGNTYYVNEIFQSKKEVENYHTKKEAIENIQSFNMSDGFVDYETYKNSLQKLAEMTNRDYDEVARLTDNIYSALIKREVH